MPETELIVRPARVADMAAAAAIYRPAVEDGTASFELTAPDAAEMAVRFAAITAGGYPYLAAERDGRLAGFAYANTFRSRPAFRPTVENSVYVAEDVHGQGIGGTLLRALIEACAAAGFRQMIAVIGDSPRQTASIWLHERCGFVHAGRLPDVGYKNGEWLDIVFMQRALGPPP
jgi:phosphinothricin acetyltransferase